MRYLAPLIFGFVGAAILVSLGVWQIQRLAWKETILAEIDARMAAAPVAVPVTPEAQVDQYLSVRASGITEAREIHLLVSTKQSGASYRIVTAFETEEGRRILLDRGIIPTPAKDDPRPPVTLGVTGNLHWPMERDSFTPDDDIAGNIWFARDIAKMAATLDTEQVLLVARDVSGPDQGITPLPSDRSGIPNDHLGYAVTWFGLALVWIGMTLFLLWRIARRTD